MTMTQKRLMSLWIGTVLVVLLYMLRESYYPLISYSIMSQPASSNSLTVSTSQTTIKHPAYDTRCFRYHTNVTAENICHQSQAVKDLQSLHICVKRANDHLLKCKRLVMLFVFNLFYRRGSKGPSLIRSMIITFFALISVLCQPLVILLQFVTFFYLDFSVKSMYEMHGGGGMLGEECQWMLQWGRMHWWEPLTVSNGCHLGHSLPCTHLPYTNKHLASSSILSFLVYHLVLLALSYILWQGHIQVSLFYSDHLRQWQLVMVVVVAVVTMLVVVGRTEVMCD